MLDPVKNFAYGVVLTAPSPATTGVTLVLESGNGALFPAPAGDGAFNIVIWPDGEEPTATNAEIVRVTIRITDTLTITREQESTTARTIVAGDQVALAPTKKLIDDIETELAGKQPIDDQLTSLAALVPGAEGKMITSDGLGGYQISTATDVRTYLNVENGATADQSNAEIKTAYEANADTNEFSDAEQTKLANIEASADVTDATNVNAAGATMNADTDVSGNSWVINEDTLVSNSSTKVPLQSNVKAYVDAAVASSVTYKGSYNASTNSPDLDTSPSGVETGDMYTVTVAGTFFTVAVEVGDVLIAEQDNPTLESHWTIVNKDLNAASIKTSYESNSDTNAFTDADESKLDAIEAGADVTDVTNVTAAGALMDSEVDADIKTLTIAASSSISGANTGDEPDASTTEKGIIQIATDATFGIGVDTSKAVTAAQVGGKAITMINKSIDGSENTLSNIASESLLCTVFFRAYCGSAQSISDATNTKVNFDTTSDDLNSDFNTTLKRFVAPYDGLYMFSAMVAYSGIVDQDRTLVNLYKNGSNFAAGFDNEQGSTGRSQLPHNVPLLLDAGDYVEIFTFQDRSVTGVEPLDVSSVRTYFTGFMVGKV